MGSKRKTIVKKFIDVHIHFEAVSSIQEGMVQSNRGETISLKKFNKRMRTGKVIISKMPGILKTKGKLTQDLLSERKKDKEAEDEKWK